MKSIDIFDKIRIPDEISPVLINIADEPAASGDSIEALLSSDEFSSWKNSGGNCLVIVNDATRPTPTAEILSSDEDFFASEYVSYIVATGAHRAPAGGEWLQIFGSLFPKIKKRVKVHDARNEETLSYYGKTSFGTEVKFNRILDEFSRLLIIGSVEPHYFAGYTGGRKAFLPGIAGYDTITSNHKLSLSDEAGLLKLAGNPVHDDMVEAAGMIAGKSIYSVMAVLRADQNIHSLHHGSLTDAFISAVEAARRVSSVEVSKPADIIISFAVSPMNRDLYQSQKAIENVRAALKPGGTIILVSECADGIGDRNFYDLLVSGNSPADVITKIRSGYKLGYHKAAKLAELMAESELYAVTSIEQSLLEAALIKPFGSLQEAFDAAVRRHLKMHKKIPEVLIVPEGSVTSVSCLPA